jgi:hypothetical protein
VSTVRRLGARAPVLRAALELVTSARVGSDGIVATR